MNYHDREENERLKAQLAGMAEISPEIMSMSLSELRAEQDRIAASYGKAGAPRYRAADLKQAVAHGLRQGFGLHVENPHPLVADMQRSDQTIDLIAAAALAVEARTGQRPQMSGDGFNTIMAALSTGDFPDLLREATTAFVRSRPSDDLALLRAVTSDVRVPNYKPSVHTFAAFEALPQPAEHTSAVFNVLKARFAAEQARVYTSTDLLLISRQALTDDAFGVIEALAVAYTVQALGTQTQMLVDLLETNGNLSDGSAFFLADVNACTVGGTLNEIGLTTIGKMLREQSRVLRAQADPGGNVLDAKIGALLVPASQEVYAQQLVDTLPVNFRPAVYASARLGEDYLYAFADPRQHPAIGRVLMQGAPDTGVSLGALRSADVWDANMQRDVSFPGLGMEVSHSCAFSPLSRAGIVRAEFGV